MVLCLLELQPAASLFHSVITQLCRVKFVVYFCGIIVVVNSKVLGLCCDGLSFIAFIAICVVLCGFVLTKSSIDCAAEHCVACPFNDRRTF